MPRTFLHRCGLGLALICAIIPRSEGQPSQKAANSTPHAPAQKRIVKGVANFGEVTPTVFRGAQPSQEGFRNLANMGVNIVVDARHHGGGNEAKEVRQLGMQYVDIPWHCPAPRDDVFVKFLKLLQDDPNKKVFVHCHLGEDRTGMMIAAYRMAAQGWSADEAMAEMHDFGFSKIHHVLCPGLASYEKNFPRHLQSNHAFDSLRPLAPAEAH